MSKRTNYDVPAARFIEVWNASESAEQVAQITGMPKPIVLARASNYRSMGINLKKMRRSGRPRLDLEELKKIAGQSLECLPAQEPFSVCDEDVARGVQEILDSLHS